MEPALQGLGLGECPVPGPPGVGVGGASVGAELHAEWGSSTAGQGLPRQGRASCWGRGEEMQAEKPAWSPGAEGARGQPGSPRSRVSPDTAPPGRTPERCPGTLRARHPHCWLVLWRLGPGLAGQSSPAARGPRTVSLPWSLGFPWGRKLHVSRRETRTRPWNYMQMNSPRAHPRQAAWQDARPGERSSAFKRASLGVANCSLGKQLVPCTETT